MLQTKKFFFSIIIPVYNTEEYLPRCLDSVASQTFGIDRVQVIIVNDSSPKQEDCEKIIESYKGKLHITYIKFKENQGTHVARKKGVESVAGEYFMFVDPDDYLKKITFQSLYDDIQNNGDADYIEFNYFFLEGKYKYNNRALSSYTFLKCDDFVWYLDEDHTIWNKCFSSSFAKKIYEDMPSFYSYYSEDYYQMGMIQIFVQKKRVLEKPLYVYVQGVGISGIAKYEKEKLKRVILSIYNVDKQLCEFYKKKDCSRYVSLVQDYSDSLYVDCILRSSMKDFVDIANEMIEEKRLNIILAKCILSLHEQILKHKRREKFFLPIIICCSFVFKLPKRQKKTNTIENVIDLTTGTFKDNATKNDIFNCIIYLEAEFSFYQARSEYYAPIKRLLRPLWHFYKRLFKR